jgi:TonB family protein
MIRQTPVAVVLLLTAVLAVSPAAAQQSTPRVPEATADARELARILYSDAMFETQMQLTAEVAHEFGKKDLESTIQRALAADESDRLRSVVRRAISATVPKAKWDEAWAAMLQQLLSPADLRGLLQFYQSPLGQRLATLGPQMQRESFAIGVRLVEANRPAMMATLMSEMQLEFANEFRNRSKGPAQAPLKVEGNIKPPSKIHDVPPEYPSIAQASRVQGTVVIEATIDQQGNVIDAKILRSIPLLDQAALDAVRQWKFTPTLKDGEPVSVIMTTTVRFSLK